jgi:IclR family acetate operon transcriptional repressor
MGPAADEVGVLGKALDVLEGLTRDGELGAAELAERTGISRPAVYRILNTLTRRGYVLAHPGPGGSRRYALGPAVYAFAGALNRAGGLQRLARPLMRELAARFGETINLAVLSDRRVLYIDMIESDQQLRTIVGIGSTDDVHSTALGKAMLAVLPPERARSMLADADRSPRTPKTKLDIDDLLADVTASAERGYAVDDEESSLGSRCVAAAVVGADGGPLGAISIDGPVARVPTERLHQMGRALRDGCAGLSAQLRGGG